MIKDTHQKLVQFGIKESRCQDVAQALDGLHHALCRLDSDSLNIINKKSLNSLLNTYCKSEELSILFSEKNQQKTKRSQN